MRTGRRGVCESRAIPTLSDELRHNLLVDWGLALECAGQPQQALAKLREAAAMEPTAHIYTQIAKVYGDHAQWSEAMDALATAEKIDPDFASIYDYRGNIYLFTNRFADAVSEYRHALALDPTLEPARQDLAEGGSGGLAARTPKMPQAACAADSSRLFR